jgi:hypothetical protein
MTFTTAPSATACGRRRPSRTAAAGCGAYAILDARAMVAPRAFPITLSWVQIAALKQTRRAA